MQPTSPQYAPHSRIMQWELTIIHVLFSGGLSLRFVKGGALHARIIEVAYFRLYCSDLSDKEVDLVFNICEECSEYPP